MLADVEFGPSYADCEAWFHDEAGCIGSFSDYIFKSCLFEHPNGVATRLKKVWVSRPVPDWFKRGVCLSFDGGMSLHGRGAGTYRTKLHHNRIAEIGSQSVSPSQQGKGVGTTLVCVWESVWIEHGVVKVIGEAAAQVGGYFQARVGQTPKRPEQEDALRDSFVRKLTKMIGDEETARQFVAASSFFDLATLELDGVHVGKQVLLGRKWDFEKLLDDSDLGYRVGLAYFKSKGLL